MDLLTHSKFFFIMKNKISFHKNILVFYKFKENILGQNLIPCKTQE